MKEKKLTPQEEAIRHDREMDRRSGIEPGNTREQKEIIEKRKKEQELTEERTRNSHLEKFIAFDSDPLAHLKEMVAQGEYQDKRHELYTLMSLIKIQLALESADLNLLTGK